MLDTFHNITQSRATPSQSTAGKVTRELNRLSDKVLSKIEDHYLQKSCLYWMIIVLDCIVQLWCVWCPCLVVST